MGRQYIAMQFVRHPKNDRILGTIERWKRTSRFRVLDCGDLPVALEAISVVFAIDYEAEDNDDERRENTNVEQTVLN
jgi:hypothetical protein